MKSIALATLLLAACGGRAAPTTTVRADARFPALTDDASVAVAASDHRAIQYTRQGRAETKVRLCVAPTGSVEAVDVVRSSGHQGYDRAVLQSARAWKFQGSEARRCTRMSVVYEAI